MTNRFVVITIYGDYGSLFTMTDGKNRLRGYNISREVTTIGEHIRGWRMVLGLTAQQVCERAQISRDTLRKIENGDTTASSESLYLVLRAIGILDLVVNAIDPFESEIGRLRADRIHRKRAR
ncbi:helix-turn-helix domain-containing protein [Corynebacterium sp. HMSC073D01]|uniref:helix-turn-helix domain-containing protein n=1 Tax=Corynebacterium sp. HMSC073D01 TaxID=1739536 RepID=UPI000B0BF53C|nr:helix-turn-helix transcriptional regulator [Corynebacterium sp. HMSC073D01]